MQPSVSAWGAVLASFYPSAEEVAVRGECCQNCHHCPLHVVVVVVVVVHEEVAKATEKGLLGVISCSPCLKINMSKGK